MSIIKDNQQSIPGGYSSPSNIPYNIIDFAINAIKSNYELIQLLNISQQVVAGINYDILAELKDIKTDKIGLYSIKVYQNLDGTLQVSSVNLVSPLGDYPDFEVNQELIKYTSKLKQQLNSNKKLSMVRPNEPLVDNSPKSSVVDNSSRSSYGFILYILIAILIIFIVIIIIYFIYRNKESKLINQNISPKLIQGTLM